VSEDAIFSGENSLIAGHGRDMIDVAVDGRTPLQIVNLSDAFLASYALAHALGVAEGRRALVGLEADDVVGDTVAVANCPEGGSLGVPRVRRRRVLFIFRLLHHSVE